MRPPVAPPYVSTRIDTRQPCSPTGPQSTCSRPGATSPSYYWPPWGPWWGPTGWWVDSGGGRGWQEGGGGGLEDWQDFWGTGPYGNSCSFMLKMRLRKQPFGVISIYSYIYIHIHIYTLHHFAKSAQSANSGLTFKPLKQLRKPSIRMSYEEVTH